MSKKLPPEFTPFEKDVPIEEPVQKETVLETPVPVAEPVRAPAPQIKRRRTNPITLKRYIFWFVLAIVTALWVGALTLSAINGRTATLGTLNATVIIALVCVLAAAIILLAYLFITGKYANGFARGEKVMPAFAAFILTLTFSFVTLVTSLSAVTTSTRLFGKGAIVYEVDRCLYNVTEENQVSLAYGGDFSGTTLIIPEEVNGYSVSEIGNGAFAGCKNLINLKIPDSVTKVADNAFANCKNIQTAIIPACAVKALPKTNLADVTITSGGIEAEAFTNCTALTRATVADGVTAIGRGAFWKCTNLKKVSIADSALNIDYNIFRQCDSLTYNEYKNARYVGNADNPYAVLVEVIDNKSEDGYAIHANTKTICTNAFLSCINLTEVTLPAGLKSVCGNAFCGTAITSIEFPASVEYIGAGDWGLCRTVTVASGNRRYHSAGDCVIETATKTLVVGSYDSVIPADGSVTKIGANAFYGCGGIKSLVIPESVTEIGDEAFRNCTNLTSVTIPENITAIGDHTFASCGLTEIDLPEGLTEIGFYAFSSCNFKTITLPDNLKKIGDYAFFSCYKLEELNIPAGVTEIGAGITRNCVALKEIKVASGNTHFTAKGNCLIDTVRKSLVAGCNFSEIPADGSIKIIDASAFADMYSLESAVIPEGVTAIMGNAFNVCTRLVSLTVPVSVKSIGATAVANCRSLTDIYYGGTKAQWKAIDKFTDKTHNSWDAGSDSYVVHCTDGDIEQLINTLPSDK